MSQRKNETREEYLERTRSRMREYRRRPEVKKRNREYMREYMREYSQRPEEKERTREYKREKATTDKLLQIMRFMNGTAQK